MMNDDCSRRDFLKKFALLSAGTLMLSATSLACYGPPGGALYGPGAVITLRVNGMFFVDAQSNHVSLYGNQSVPIHTQFLIEFSQTMDKSAPTTLSLTDSNNSPVADSKTWGNDYTVHVTPNSDLMHSADYTLRVGNDTVDINGNKLEITDTATAVFKTVA